MEDLPIRDNYDELVILFYEQADAMLDVLEYQNELGELAPVHIIRRDEARKRLVEILLVCRKASLDCRRKMQAFEEQSKPKKRRWLFWWR